jgi:hypothetical protein
MLGKFLPDLKRPRAAGDIPTTLGSSSELDKADGKLT